MLVFWEAGVAQSSYLIFFPFDRVSNLDITEEKLCRWEVKIWINRNNQRRRKKQMREKKFERERIAMSKGKRRNKWKYGEGKNQSWERNGVKERGWEKIEEKKTTCTHAHSDLIFKFIFFIPYVGRPLPFSVS